MNILRQYFHVFILFYSASYFHFILPLLKDRNKRQSEGSRCTAGVVGYCSQIVPISAGSAKRCEVWHHPDGRRQPSDWSVPNAFHWLLPWKLYLFEFNIWFSGRNFWTFWNRWWKNIIFLSSSAYKFSSYKFLIVSPKLLSRYSRSCKQ